MVYSTTLNPSKT